MRVSSPRKTRVNRSDVPTPRKTASNLSKTIPMVTPAMSTGSQLSSTLTRTSLPKPKRPKIVNPNIARTEKLNEDIEEIIKHSLALIDGNQSTPEISDAILVPLAHFQKTVEPFIKVSLQFFRRIEKIQMVTPTNQIISASLVQTPMCNFCNTWDRFQAALNKIGQITNFPHAHLITLKFHRIQSTYDQIQQKNLQKKYPSASLTKCVDSIQALCDTLTANILDLFNQPTFPNFDTDVNSLYKNNIKSFMRISNEAFINEVPHSGLLIGEMNRLKQSVIMDCNEIIDSLKMAFDFPAEIKYLIDLADSIKSQIKELDLQFQFPNNVVRPLPENERKTVEKKPKEVIVNPSFEVVKTDEELSEEVIVRIFKLLNAEYDTNNHHFENLCIIEKNVEGLLEQYKIVSDQNNIREKRISKLEMELSDATILFNEKSDVMDLDYTERIKKINELNNEINKLQNERDYTQEELNQLKISHNILLAGGDPAFLRKSLVEVGNGIAEKLGIPNEEIKDSKSDFELANNIKGLLQRQCQHCIQKDAELQTINNYANEAADVENASTIDCIDILKDKLKDLEDMNNILQNEREAIIDSLEIILKCNGHVNAPFEITLQNAAVSKVQNRIIQLQDNVDTEKKNYENLKNSFYDELMGLIKEFDPDINNVDDASSTLRDKIKNAICKLEKRKAKIGNLKSKVSQTKENLKLCKNFLKPRFEVDNWDEIKNYLEGETNPIDEKIEQLEERIEDLIETTKGLCLRIFGIVNMDPSDPNLPIDILAQTTSKIVGSIQDDRELIIKERYEAIEVVNKMRNCLKFVEVSLRKHANASFIDIDKLTDDNLMRRVETFCSKIDSIDFSGKWITVSSLDLLIQNSKRIIGASKEPPQNALKKIDEMFTKYHNELLNLNKFETFLSNNTNYIGNHQDKPNVVWYVLTALHSATSDYSHGQGKTVDSFFITFSSFLSSLLSVIPNFESVGVSTDRVNI